jgi:hypothetical protein
MSSRPGGKSDRSGGPEGKLNLRDLSSKEAADELRRRSEQLTTALEHLEDSKLVTQETLQLEFSI